MSHTPIFWNARIATFSHHHNDSVVLLRDSPSWYINGLVLTIGKQAFCLTHTKSYNFIHSALFFTAHPCRLTSFHRHTCSLALSPSFSLFLLSFYAYPSISIHGMLKLLAGVCECAPFKTILAFKIAE